MTPALKIVARNEVTSKIDSQLSSVDMRHRLAICG